MMDDHRRIAVVTGAGQGIGAAVAQRLADDGHAIALVDIDESSCEAVRYAIEHRGRRALAIRADISDEISVRDAFRRITAELGEPTILVNNAGIIRDNLLFKMSTGDWDDVIGVHLRGSFLVTRAIQQFMVGAKWGRIVNLSSTGALGSRGQANYSAAKAGLQGFTKTLALELGKFGITSNAVAPGFIETAMTEATAHRLGMRFEEFRDSLLADIPVGRVGTPDDIAHAVSFLVSDGAGYVSGQVLYVAGGPQG